MPRLTLLAAVLIACITASAPAAAPATDRGVAAREDKDFEPIHTRNPEPERYAKFTQMAAQGLHMKVVAATCFGTGGYEEFTGVAVLGDGTIVACGNASGPELPAGPAPVVLGKGQGQAAREARPLVIPVAAKGKAPAAAPVAATGTGVMVFYDGTLDKIGRMVRFDWGVASISAATASGDGKAILVAGGCGDAISSVTAGAGAAKTAGNGASAYVMRLGAEGKVEWIWVLGDGKVAPRQLWVDKEGAVYFDAGGLVKISADGGELKSIASQTGSGTAKWLGIDPADGSAFFGGDRNTKTNREPWRQPFLYKFDAGGQKVWTLWEVPSKTVGSDAYGLESDSSIRGLAVNHKGELIVSGWSDGGNTILPRKANDFKHYAPEGGFGMVPWWPKGASSFAHLMRIDGKTLETKSHQWWLPYIPSNFIEERPRNAPNGISIDAVCVLADDSVAITGRSATGLIQTPNAFWKDPGKGEKYGGNYVAVFDPTMAKLRFSSYLPGCADLRMAATKNGLVVVSKTTGHDDATPQTATPLVKELQKPAGASDGHVVVMELPK